MRDFVEFLAYLTPLKAGIFTQFFAIQDTCEKEHQSTKMGQM
jgi:hypothetical protein